MIRILFASILFCALSSAQTPAFEVADIQLNKSGARETKGQFLPGGRVQIQNLPMRRLIAEAYKLNLTQVTGGPRWMDSDTFDIVAKAVPNSTDDDLRRMLQTLLAERFHLVLHHEDKLASVYALIPGKTGLAIHPAADSQARTQCQRGAVTKGVNHVTCTNVAMADLATLLPRLAPGYFDLPVVNLVEAAGAYDFILEWTGRTEYDKAVAKTNSGELSDTPLITMFEAVDRLGLKLEQRRLRLDTLVIDSVDRTPTSN